MPDPDTDLYFFHIPKTAGSSVGHFLRSVYPKENRMPFVELKHLGAANREFLNRHRYFQSHVGNLLYPFLDRDIPTITFLRDPFEQSISRLRFMVHHKKGRERFSHLLGWCLELYKKRYGPLVHWCLDCCYSATGQFDFQSRMLGLTPSEEFIVKDKMDPRGWHWEQIRQLRRVGMERVLDAAKRRLDSMAVVGTVEQFDESIGLVCDFLGVPKPETPPVERVAPGRSILSSYRNDPTVPPALARIVERNIQYDIEIHRYATELLQRRLGRHAGESNGKAA
jgi:hypothetical protein